MTIEKIISAKRLSFLIFILSFFTRSVFYTVKWYLVATRPTLIRRMAAMSLPGWWACRTRDLSPGGCEFDNRLRGTYFSSFTSAEACKKSLWLWKESCVSTGVRKPGNMYVIDPHDMTLAVKLVLNPNSANAMPYWGLFCCFSGDLIFFI